MPEAMPSGDPWPRFSVVTPSFNQGEYLEETIRSVLLQGYPELEYMVIDGGSSDESVDIIRRYEPWLTFWLSEPDKGQSDAINKGLRRATGEVQAWLNSDDVFYAGALERGAAELCAAGADIIIAGMNKVQSVNGDLLITKFTHGGQGVPIHAYRIFKEHTDTAFSFMQPSMFWRKWCWDATGGLDVDYHWVMDIEWCTRALAEGAKVVSSDSLIARFLLHPKSKTEMYRYRQHHEWALLYLRLIKDPRFRAFPCLLSWARAESVAARELSKSLSGRGEVLRPFLLRLISRGLQVVQRVIPPPIGWVGPPKGDERGGPGMSSEVPSA